MNWFEQISIRLARQDDIDALLSLVGCLQQSAHATVKIEYYRNIKIESDWMVVLRCDASEKVIRKSLLGRVICEELKPFGLVNHMVWEQLDKEIPKGQSVALPADKNRDV